MNWYRISQKEPKEKTIDHTDDAIALGYERIVKDLVKDPSKIDTMGKRIVLDLIRDKRANKHSDQEEGLGIDRDMILDYIQSHINPWDNETNLFEYLDDNYHKALNQIVDRILENIEKYHKEVTDILDSIPLIPQPQQPGGGLGGMAESSNKTVTSKLMKQAPFESAKQEYWMMINKPEMWRKWYEEHGHHPDFKNYKKNKKKKSNNETYHLGTYKICFSHSESGKDVFDIMKNDVVVKTFSTGQDMTADAIKKVAAKSLGK